MEAQDLKYLRAKNTVKKIRGFYIHSFAFVVVILIAALLPFFGSEICMICFSNNPWINLLGFFPWGIGLFFHGVTTFHWIGPFHKWEQRKIKQFMEEDE